MKKHTWGWTCILFLVALALLSTPTFAFNCDLLNGNERNDCKALRGIVDEQTHDLIVSDFAYSYNYYPYHDLIRSWNLALEFESAPKNVEIHEGTWIKNAWMKIVSVMPSVLEQDTLFVDENVSILTPYNFEIVIPENYEAKRERQTSQGDCKREYLLRKNTQAFNVFVNNNPVGEEILTFATVLHDTTITARLDLTADVEVVHYKWEKDCVDCEEYEYECEFDYKERIRDKITITDTLRVKHYNNDLEANITTINAYSGNVRLRPQIGTTTSALVQFEDAYYAQFNTFYDVMYDYAPYYVLTLRAHHYNLTSKENVLVDKDDFIVKTTDCTLFLWNHFITQATPCNITQEIPQPTIKTDQLLYKVNDTIKVTSVSDQPVLVTYANKTKNVTSSAEFIAKYGHHKITASIGENTVTRTINVTKGNKLSLLFDFSAFFLVTFVLFRGIQHGVGVPA